MLFLIYAEEAPLPVLKKTKKKDLLVPSFSFSLINGR